MGREVKRTGADAIYFRESGAYNRCSAGCEKALRTKQLGPLTGQSNGNECNERQRKVFSVSVS